MTLTAGDATSMRDDVLASLRLLYGEEWGSDPDANLRFSLEVEALVQDLEGLLLMGEPEIAEGEVRMKFWVDTPVPDLMTADQLAYAVFARISEEVFFAERCFDASGLSYPFLTGSQRRGHLGVVSLTGPHAADFSDRFRQRITGGSRFHA